MVTPPAARASACAPTECAPTPVASVEQIAQAAAIFKALGDPVRLRLFNRIASAVEPVCVCDIDQFDVSQPTISHHLRKLREAGLIDCERRGTWVYYWPVPGAMAPIETVLAPANAAVH